MFWLVSHPVKLKSLVKNSLISDDFRLPIFQMVHCVLQLGRFVVDWLTNYMMT